MVDGFSSIEGQWYSGWCVWDLRKLAQFQGIKMWSELFQGFMDGFTRP